jgi:hypothetical protein
VAPEVNLQHTEGLNVRIFANRDSVARLMLFMSTHPLEFSLNHQVPQHRSAVTLCFPLLATDDLWS